MRRNGLKVKLQEQPFQVLALLLETPGEVVTRDVLRNRLWPADTFVDFDHSLNAAIRRVRDALGDSAENPTFVETIPRRGYRFLAPVSVESKGHSEIPIVPTEPADAPDRTRRKRRVLLWSATAIPAALLVLLGIKLGLSLAQREAPAQAQPRISRLTANPADDRVRAAAISHDGKYLAYSDETGLYLRQIDTGETHAVALPHGTRASALSWLPDNSHIIAALAEPASSSGIWEVSVFGGNPRKLADDGHSPAVSPDGKQIAFITGQKLHNQLWIMAADGEQLRKIVGNERDLLEGLAWSPEGSRIAYVRGAVAYGYGVKNRIEFVDVRDLRDLRIGTLSGVSNMGWFAAISGPLAWTSDGRLIYTVAEPPPRQLDSNLWSISLDSGGHPTCAPLRLTSDNGVVSSISSSADGKRIAYVKNIPQPDVYVARVEGKGNINEPVRLTLDDRQDMPFDWTPDGKAVIFISDRTGIFSIYRQGVDQMVPEQLVAGNHPAMGARLSPDGSQLLYLSYPNWSETLESIPLMRLPLAGGPPQQVLTANWITNQQCARAPGSTCVYSVVNEDKLTLFKFDPMNGSSSQVYRITDSVPQLYNWSLSPDGGTIAIARGKEGGEEPWILFVSLTGAAERRIAIKGGVAALDWAADGKSIWASSAGDMRHALLNIDLQGRTRVVWHPENLDVHWAVPSRDGRSLALHVSTTSANVSMLDRQ